MEKTMMVRKGFTVVAVTSVVVMASDNDTVIVPAAWKLTNDPVRRTKFPFNNRKGDEESGTGPESGTEKLPVTADTATKLEVSFTRAVKHPTVGMFSKVEMVLARE